MHDFSKDDFTDLFSYWGSGIQYETWNGNTILFMLGPSCLYNGNHRCNSLLPRNSSELRNDFDKNYHGFEVNITNLPPAKVGKTARYVSVSASTFIANTKTYVYFCWIQIELNIVVNSNRY
jgi:hypothetical protein